MEKLFFVFLIMAMFSSCKKNPACTNATVTLKARSCNGIGVIIYNKTYPTDDLPDSLVVAGKKICIEYSLYDDPRMCQCCGGTYAHIINVH